MTAIQIGRLLRAGTSGFVVGCRVSQLSSPSFGALVRVPLASDTQIFGLIYDIHIDDDGLVRQLVTAEGIDDAVIQDNRENRNIPLEISVQAVGYEQNGQILHLLPPRPPLSLDKIYLCGASDICRFTAPGLAQRSSGQPGNVRGRFGYFRHILGAKELPAAELLAAHIRQAHHAHQFQGQPGWAQQATQELITLLRDDYPTLMNVLSALSDALVDAEGAAQQEQGVKPA